MGTKSPTKKADSGAQTAGSPNIPAGGSNTINIPIEKIEIKKGFNHRDIGDIAMLKANLRQHGLITPITVCPTKPGADTYYVVAGHRRLTAWSEMGKKHIAAVVRDVNIEDPDTFAVAFSENVSGKDDGVRRELSATEIADAITHMGKLLKTDDAKLIGEKLGLSKISVNRYSRVNELPEALRKRVAAGEVGYLAATRVLDAPAELQATIAKKIVAGVDEATAQKIINNEKKAQEGERAVSKSEREKAKAPSESKVKKMVQEAKDSKAGKKAAKKDEPANVGNRPWGQRPGIQTNPLGDRVVRDALLKLAKRALNAGVDITEATEAKDDAALAKAKLAYATNAAYVAAMVWRFGEIDGELPNIDSADFKEVLEDIQSRLDAEADKKDKAKAAESGG